MRVRIIVGLVLAVLGAQPASADAATQIGQASGTNIICGGGLTLLQSVSNPAGPSYAVPAPGGVITAWRIDVQSAGQTRELKVFRATGTPDQYRVIGQTDVTFPGTGVQQFPARISAAAGDVIGFTGATNGCYTPVSVGGSVAGGPGDPEVGSDFAAPDVQSPAELNLAATVELDADQDGFGDETQDQCPAQATTTGACDLKAPFGQLTKHPKKRSTSRTAIFKFKTDDPAATYECKLDKKPFAPCTSPRKYRKLKVRKHKFQLRASDAVGNVATPAIFRWRVVN